jgi:predicted transcriptional regulator
MTVLTLRIDDKMDAALTELAQSTGAPRATSPATRFRARSSYSG